MLKPNKVFVVRGHSESGDHYLATFSKKPTKKQLVELVNTWDPGTDGPGYAGSYVHIDIIKSTVDEDIVIN
jgi:hypothetical protein